MHVLVMQVLEAAEVPGQASFTAYSDGRARAFFTDRTIMHLNTTHSHCKVTWNTQQLYMTASGLKEAHLNFADSVGKRIQVAKTSLAYTSVCVDPLWVWKELKLNM